MFVTSRASRSIERVNKGDRERTGVERERAGQTVPWRAIGRKKPRDSLTPVAQEKPIMRSGFPTDVPVPIP